MSLKQYVLILHLIIMSVLYGCTQALTLNERELQYIWNEYHSREFYEGFYEKLSSRQRKQIMMDIAEENGLEYVALMEELQRKSPEKYSKLFY